MCKCTKKDIYIYMCVCNIYILVCICMFVYYVYNMSCGHNFSKLGVDRYGCQSCSCFFLLAYNSRYESVSLCVLVCSSS